ncbi:hypothetical protein [Kitasatospora sp. NPDC057015]|uniref:hypothetical protein n=1 Tax=Kitasatospora sp. NPDC057015 TaxID=3346001 RepID=UPI0036274D67
MTSMQQSPPQPSSRPDPLGDPGTWLFVPDSRNAQGEVRPGYLSRDGERVVLAYCSGILGDLLRTIRQLEDDVAARWDALPLPVGA